MITGPHACGERAQETRWTSTRPERHGSLWVRRDAESNVLGLAGEADFTNHDQLLEILAEAMLTEGDVRLDVSGLTFVDVAATRAIISTAQKMPAGRRLVLIEPCRSLRIILSSIGIGVPAQLVLSPAQDRQHWDSQV
jgi:anti-anti-sigma regulatory factor